MISFRHTGDFSKLTRYLEGSKEAVGLTRFTKSRNQSTKYGFLDKYGREGVAALASATPVESGLTANSWYYTIEQTKGSVSIVFNNSNIQNGVPIAIIVQLGHGTGTGGWVQGRDYINPAIQPIFDKLVNDVWGEVTRL